MTEEEHQFEPENFALHRHIIHVHNQAVTTRAMNEIYDLCSALINRYSNNGEKFAMQCARA
jgi:hypothetical protein